MKKVNKKNNGNRFDIIDNKNKAKGNKKKNVVNAKGKNNQNKKKKKKKRSILKIIFTFFLIMCIIGVLSVAAFLGYIVLTAPEFDESAFVVKDQTVVYDVDGNIIAKLGTEKRESISYDELPQVLIDAIIATEDSRFFQHNGVDLLRFIKATALQLVGKEAGGASTLTMQIVKNNLTKKDATETDRIKKVIRKFQDVYLSVFKVEKEYSKEEIFEMYINDNFLGGSYYGVEEASKYYFGKSASDLTLPEAATIAGLFQLPGSNNPYNNIDGATARRKLVLQYMVNHGYITEEEKKMAERVTISSLLAGNSANNSEYQGFIDTVINEVEELTGDNPATTPMKIYTTMERSIQNGVNAVLNSDSKSYWKDDNATAGIAIINVETGGIAAVGGGRNKTGERVFNNATQAKRQPGSTAKPIFDYGPAIEHLNYSTYTPIVDEPWSYTNGPAVNNWDFAYNGLHSMKYQLMWSRNTPALKTFQQVGAKNSQKFAYSLGLDVALNSSSENYRIIDENTGLDNAINEAYSIGGVAEGFSPLEMASAYSAFASGGYYTKSHTVNKIEYRETGEIQEFKYAKTRVMKDSTAYIINNILEGASTSGWTGRAYVPGSHVAVKTGTTNYDSATMKARGLPSSAVRDLWTIAYTPKYTFSIWYGYENLSLGYNTSAVYKENITADIMKYIPKDPKGWSVPSSVVASRVETGTWPAALPSEDTPSNLIETHYFVRGTQPTEVSERFAKLNDVEIASTNTSGNNVTISWKYSTPAVLTEEYLRNYFNKSQFGNSKEALLNERIGYNSSTLGEIVFAIYKADADGKLTLLDTTTEKTYSYTGYGDVTLVIKAEHSIFKANASSGVKVNATLVQKPTATMSATLNGQISVKANVGTYEESGFKKIYYDNIDITSTANIKYQLVNGDTHEFSTTAELEEYINQLSAGTYKINYVISYLDQTLVKTRNLTLF